ncbi:BTAD domain-containing putative transcriptional regulator [Streptomyces sp. TG1A-8]|uniref:AfsR/SARP family transcriptional regulator n=1 Tax=Streptomyces sp. TG1A-8 TaxID=3051385 RepID=UPI00265C6D16|nr:BTAD domain-containing putative transcriptional regulator [Streptomyces sp. TG1A-8]MDO0924304.1 BTAD domain-containing putative transcriptional regulator [Streptomyces sp. TG1A-8]
MRPQNDTPRADQAPAALLRLLGDFRLEVNRRNVYLPPSAQRLLACLALHAGGVARERASQLLWPDLPHARAGASLRSTLWRISRRSDQQGLVDLGAARLSVSGRVDVDLHTASRYAAELANGPTRDAPGVEIPPVLRQDLLPSWCEDWLTDAREHFHQTRLYALEAVSRHHRRQGHMCTALRYAMTAVEAEPMRESAHREVTAVHLAEGNTAEALRHFENYRRRLRGELGLPPSTGYRRLLAPYLGRPLD